MGHEQAMAPHDQIVVSPLNMLVDMVFERDRANESSAYRIFSHSTFVALGVSKEVGHSDFSSIHSRTATSFQASFVGLPEV